MVIARAGKPVARLVALAPDVAKPRPVGIGVGRFTMSDNFDAFGGEEIIEMFLGDQKDDRHADQHARIEEPLFGTGEVRRGVREGHPGLVGAQSSASARTPQP